MGLMSKKRTGVLRMLLNMRLCNVSAEFTRTLNMIRPRMKPKMIVAPVKPDEREMHKSPLPMGDTCLHLYFTTSADFDQEHTCIDAKIEIQVELLSGVIAESADGGTDVRGRNVQLRLLCGPVSHEIMTLQ